jgi:hypothetical protein
MVSVQKPERIFSVPEATVTKNWNVWPLISQGNIQSAIK